MKSERWQGYGDDGESFCFVSVVMDETLRHG